VIGLVAIRRGRYAADEILAKVFGLPVRKARRVNPNKPKGFDAFVVSLLGDLVEEAEPIEREAIKTWLRDMDRNWPSMTKDQRNAAIDRAAREWLDTTRRIPVHQWPTYAAHGKTIVEQTKAAAVLEHGIRIVPSFDLVDAQAVKSSAEMQAFYTRNSYGLREVQMSEQARKIVSAGIEGGLDRYEIGKDLAAMAATGPVSWQRSMGYFQMIASVFTARARSYSNLSAYQQAEIERFRFEAVLDEVTTDVCRMMHGKTFTTSTALEGYAKVAASEDPEDVKTIQPWVQTGKNEQGDQILYYKNAEGSRVKVASVNESAVGKKDTIGSYAGMSPRQLERAGISAPPLHGHCRSVIVPASMQGGVGAVPRGPAPAAVPVAPSAPVAPAAPPPAPAPVVPTAPAPAPVVPPPAAAPAPPPVLRTDQDRAWHALDRLGRLPRADPNDREFDAIVNPIPSARPDSYALPWTDKTERQVGRLSERFRQLEASGGAPPAQQVKINQLRSMSPDLLRANVMTGIGEEFTGAPGEIPLLVRHRGQLYIYENAERVAAATLGGRSTIAAHVIDLDADEPWPKPAPTPAAAPPLVRQPAPIAPRPVAPPPPPPPAPIIPARARTFRDDEARGSFALEQLSGLPEFDSGEPSDLRFVQNPIPSFTREVTGYSNPPWSAENQARLTKFEERLGVLRKEGRAPLPRALRIGELQSMSPDLLPKNIAQGVVEEFYGVPGDTPVVVRTGGKLYVYTNVERVAAAKLGGRSTVSAHVIDLDARKPWRAPPKKKKPEPAPAPAPGEEPKPKKIPVSYVSSEEFARKHTSAYASAFTKKEFAAAARKVFPSDKIPTVESLEKVWGSEAAEHSIKISSVRAYDEDGVAKVWLSGDIIGPKGNSIGRITRTFIRYPKDRRHPNGLLEVHHDYFKIEDADEQGKKTGESMLRQSIQTYEELGAHKLTVDAAWVGRYTWATFGYNWTENYGRNTIAPRLTRYLVSKGIDQERAAGLAASVATESWAVAALDVDDRRINVTSEGKKMDMKLGKAFLLEYTNTSGDMWSGTIDLEDKSHPTYQRAKARVGL
jgi:hypothetical protein